MTETIQEFILTHHAKILEKCEKVVWYYKGDPAIAKDISQDVCLKLLLSDGLNFPAEKDRAFSYIGTMVHRFWFSRNESESKRSKAEKHAIIEEGGNVEQYNTEVEVTTRSTPGISELQALHNRIIEDDFLTPSEFRLWVYVLCYTPRETIADELGMPKERVSTYKHKLFTKIRKHINREDI